MQGIIKLPSIAKTGAMDGYLVTDLPGLARVARECSSMSHATGCTPQNSWTGKRFSFADTCNAIERGDITGVAASDALLAKLESAMPSMHSKAWTVTDDVAGALPNIGAFLSGHPMNMRRRARTLSQQAPLVILADLTLSAGISGEQMRGRGAAILALVRILSERRPVELWATVGVGSLQTCFYVMARIETSPLDLARAAHVLTEPSACRGVGYAIGQKAHEDGTLATRGWGGGWGYSSAETYRQHAADSMLRVISPGSDALYMAAAHVRDAAIEKPVEWIVAMLKKYGGEAIESDAT